MGSRKAGKSSVIKTVFQQVPVKDVPYFGVTQKIEKINYDTIMPLQIWDTPSNFELDQLEVPLSSFSTIVYVMDMQQDDSYHEAILRFVHIMIRAHIVNPSMKFSVFIHKSEVLSEDYRGENYAEIQRVVSEELEDFPYHTLQAQDPHTNFSDIATQQQIANQLLSELRFEVTSIHNVTLRDAWSKVIQGCMEMLPAVEALLLNFTETSGMDNSYLFDIKSGVVLATDNRHRNDATLEQVTEYLTRFLQFRDLYKDLRHQPDGETNGEAIHADANANSNGNENGSGVDEANGDDDEGEPEGWWDEEDPSAPWMTQSTRLMPNTTISLWQFTPYIALVVLLRTDTWQTRRGMIEYNLTFLRQGVRRILMEV
ncbi:hypothetical protein EHS25_001072 [Saitozyma podzolica]|uniref:GTP-binding protein n=1 Tax=Saitozyma podzolica TaxID=1890683 RepID=A0A427YHF4_9TREE|nr:hypothetical protein EHS25_001072 [Saitozyma podzolica]